MSGFFIARPIFAWVLAIAVMAAGLLALPHLAVEQYPRIAPPVVRISASFPGASAETVDSTLTQVIEQKMKGIDRLRTVSAFSDAAGAATILLTFEPGADPDIAQVQVNNKLQLALPLLPAAVQQQGLSVTKANDDVILVVALVSADGAVSAPDLADLMVSRLQDDIARLPGVGDIQVFGAQHAMRIWLNPDRLTSYALSVADVTNAIRARNADVSAGQIGGTPALPGQMVSATIKAQTRLQNPEQFGAILLKVKADGGQVRLRDVARIEIGAENYDTSARYNGKPAAGMAIKPAVGANALDIALRVRARMAALQPTLPPGVEIAYPFDTIPAIRVSLATVSRTLAEAIALVVVVMFLFLGHWRATLVPAIAVPVVLAGTVAVLAITGQSINTLTLFAMVLAIGLLVDDAIVVVENVERIMRSEGLDPVQATSASMGQISGALVAITLVLAAIFVPMAFFGGATGAIYRQFSVTLVSAMVLSVLVALTLTPALCATLLRPPVAPRRGREGDGRRRGVLWAYRAGLVRVIRRPWRLGVLYALLIAGLVVLLGRLPTAFLPDEDQGLLYVAVATPTNASLERTEQALAGVEAHFLGPEAARVESVFTIAGFNFGGSAQNAGMAFVQLRPWEQRPGADDGAAAVAWRAIAALDRLKDAQAFAFTPPAVMELGNAGGFELHLEDRAGLGHGALMAAAERLVAAAEAEPAVMAVRANGLDDTPQLTLSLDQEKADALGLALDDINTTLSVAWGSAYVNDFVEAGRVKKVLIQADARFRMQAEDLFRWHVRNDVGGMVPFATVLTADWGHGSPQLERHDGFASRQIVGAAAPGWSSGQAMAAMERIAATLPAGIALSWAGLSYEERQAGAQAPLLQALSVALVLLCLAALFESWALPLVVLLALPLGALGAVAAVRMAGLANDIYFQIGLLTTMGLTAKNAILIVEFASALVRRGHGARGAALLAARRRLRPILMTSLAFGLGVVPLALGTGAGRAAQNAVGIGVLGGTLSATVLTIVFVPLAFALVAARRGGPASRVRLMSRVHRPVAK